MSSFAPIYDFLHSKAGLALFVCLLIISMWKMFRSPATNTSQRLMRWRVGLQFSVIALIAFLLWLRH